MSFFDYPLEFRQSLGMVDNLMRSPSPAGAGEGDCAVAKPGEGGGVNHRSILRSGCKTRKTSSPVCIRHWTGLDALERRLQPAEKAIIAALPRERGVPFCVLSRLAISFKLTFPIGRHN